MRVSVLASLSLLSLNLCVWVSVCLTFRKDLCSVRHFLWLFWKRPNSNWLVFDINASDVLKTPTYSVRYFRFVSLSHTCINENIRMCHNNSTYRQPKKPKNNHNPKTAKRQWKNSVDNGRATFYFIKVSSVVSQIKFDCSTSIGTIPFRLAHSSDCGYWIFCTKT